MISHAKILSDVERLPTLPVSIAKISALINDEGSSWKDFEEAIKPDPALTANVLRIANSAYFGCPRQVTSSSRMSAELGHGDVDEAFTCGLLHDIGKLVTSTYLAQESATVVEKIRLGENAFIATEQEILGLGPCRDRISGGR